MLLVTDNAAKSIEARAPTISRQLTKIPAIRRMGNMKATLEAEISACVRSQLVVEHFRLDVTVAPATCLSRSSRSVTIGILTRSVVNPICRDNSNGGVKRG